MGTCWRFSGSATHSGRRRAAARSALLAVVLLSGCAAPPRFPAPLSRVRIGETLRLSYDVSGDGVADYWQYAQVGGRKLALADAPQPQAARRLGTAEAGRVPHYLIVLDGVPYEVVARLYRNGYFRWFHPPVRVINCFPGMTDLALADLLHTLPCRGYQAYYYDSAAGQRSAGNEVYLAGANSPWLAHMDYRASLWWDLLVYLDPQTVFHHELTRFRDTFAERPTTDAQVYSVGTAGLGTRGGRPAIRAYLKTLDVFCERLIHAHDGRLHLTLTADHGHNLAVNRSIDLRGPLRACGYDLTERLRDENDVVAIRYGLVTYVELHTADPPGVAGCLAQHPAATFTAYAAGDGEVVVVGKSGEARIRRGSGGWFYAVSGQDPLGLEQVRAELRAADAISAYGVIDDAALFAATVHADYPDPVARLWRAFYELVEHPADVLVNLRDGSCYGSAFFETMVGQMTSTHGSLNRRNSTTFALTTLGRLPDALRTRDLLPALETLRPPAPSEE